MTDPVLCYVKDNWAWFTTASLKDQWGDDWDDAPYEHNAGSPYEWDERKGYGCKCYDERGFDCYTGVGKDGRLAKCGEPGHKKVPPKERYHLTKVGWEGPWETPADRAGGNSRFCVREINAKHVAWLLPYPWGNTTPPPPPIHAGTTLDEFRRIVTEHGGRVYEAKP